MGGIISSTALGALMIQSPKPGGKPSVPRSGGMPSKEIWTSLNRYRPLVEGRDQDLLDALRSLAEEKRQARVTHACRVEKRFGLPIRTRADWGEWPTSRVSSLI